MISKKRRDKKELTVIAPQSAYQEGFIATLRPEGSFDGTRIYLEKREIKRPTINYVIVSLNVLIPMLVCLLFCWWDMFYAMIGIAVYILIRLRGIAIWSIRIYQRYAPEDIRNSCVFEPSCSEYMILSMKKYGLIRGSVKGIKRLKRCHLPNEGIDYP